MVPLCDQCIIKEDLDKSNDFMKDWKDDTQFAGFEI